ncbi:MAG: helix-turn-helix transcriptional regulator [Bacteroidota bacterium]
MPARNVFETLGFGREEAANLRLRARLMMALTEHIEARDLTQSEAAKVIGCSQPRVSNLMNGKINAFTVDFLVNALAQFGINVDLVIGNAAEGTLEST